VRQDLAGGLTKAGRALPRKVFFAYLLVFWATLLSRVAVFLVRGWAALHYPFELDYGEGIVIWQAQHVTDLKVAFRSIAEFPHVVFHYPPLYHVASRLFALLTGDLLIAGRLVSIVATFGISFLSGLIVWSALPSRIPVSVRATGAVAGAALCYSIDTLSWAVYMRVDMLALFFEFAGIYLYLQGNRRPWLEYAAFLCFCLALYTKQTMVAGPLACGVVALLIAPRRAVKEVGLLVACAGVTMVALELLTRGQFFRHLFLYNRNPFSLRRLISILKPNIMATGSIAAAALALPVAFLGGLLGRPGDRLTRFRAAMLRSPSHRFIAVGGLFLVLALCVSLTAGKAGASPNYMLEWNFAACPLAAMLFADVLRRWHQHRSVPAAYVAILLSPVLYANTFGNLFMPTFLTEGGTARQQSSAAVVERIRQVEGPVYSTDMVLLYRAGKALAAEPAIISVLAEGGQWNDRPFVNRIESGYFDLIVSRYSLSDSLFFSPGVGSAIGRAYKLKEDVGGYKIYSPRERN
jgi:4-amino-4-deoxy-L-arabinose transferase-like glycosyltransferase